jgi:hypothetical protein
LLTQNKQKMVWTTHKLVPARLGRLAPTGSRVVGLAARTVAELVAGPVEAPAVHSGTLRLAVSVLQLGCSMLGSKFSAIFANFRREKSAFLDMIKFL